MSILLIFGTKRRDLSGTGSTMATRARRLGAELAKAEREAAQAVAIVNVTAAKGVLIGELRTELAQARCPWWRKLLG